MILNMSDILLNYAAIEAAIFSLLLNGRLVITSKYLVYLVQMHYHLSLAFGHFTVKNRKL